MDLGETQRRAAGTAPGIDDPWPRAGAFDRSDEGRTLGLGDLGSQATPVARELAMQSFDARRGLPERSAALGLDHA